MEAWLAENLPRLTIRRAQECASLAGLIDRFDPADDWYWRLSPEDRAAGWRTKHETGGRYGIDVIKLHHRYLNREPPPKQRAAKDRKAVQESKVSAAEKERDAAVLDAMRARNALADEAVERHALAKRNRVLARDGQRQEARQRALAAGVASLTRRCTRLKRDNARLRKERERP